jgi:hypothetical protein
MKNEPVALAAAAAGLVTAAITIAGPRAGLEVTEVATANAAVLTFAAAYARSKVRPIRRRRTH